jgi:hypothetical protein
VTVSFLRGHDGSVPPIVLEAKAGDLYLSLAKQAGVEVELGCCNGTCGICEVRAVCRSSQCASMRMACPCMVHAA